MWKCMTVWPALTPLLEMTRKPSSRPLALATSWMAWGHGAHGLSRHVVGDVAVVLLGDHERVDGRLGIEVIERDDLIVLIDDSRGDLVVGNFAENAITHAGSFLVTTQKVVLFSETPRQFSPLQRSQLSEFYSSAIAMARELHPYARIYLEALTSGMINTGRTDRP